jgi:beta-lactamase regulating signal transducer with metallopeptidase domain
VGARADASHAPPEEESVTPLGLQLAALLLQVTVVAAFALVLQWGPGSSPPRNARLARTMPFALVGLPLVRGLMPSTVVPVVELPHAWFQAPMTAALPALTLERLLLAIWCVGAAMLLLRMVAGLLVVSRAIRSGVAVQDDYLRATLARAAMTMGVTGSLPRLVVVPQVDSPAVFGVRRHVIVLPSWFATIAPDAQFAMLCHELAHVANRDWLHQQLARLVFVVYWPIPLVLLWMRRATHTRELLADRAVLRAGISPSDYARHLVHAAHACLRAAPPTAPAVVALTSGGRGLLTQRVHALFREDMQCQGRHVGPLTLLVLTMLVGSIDPISCPPRSSTALAVTTVCPP